LKQFVSIRFPVAIGVAQSPDAIGGQNENLLVANAQALGSCKPDVNRRHFTSRKSRADLKWSRHRIERDGRRAAILEERKVA